MSLETTIGILPAPLENFAFPAETVEYDLHHTTVYERGEQRRYSISERIVGHTLAERRLRLQQQHDPEISGWFTVMEVSHHQGRRKGVYDVSILTPYVSELDADVTMGGYVIYSTATDGFKRRGGSFGVPGRLDIPTQTFPTRIDVVSTLENFVSSFRGGSFAVPQPQFIIYQS